MIEKEKIFEVTIVTCWETGSTRAEFIKAYDSSHALRIAMRLFSNVVGTKPAAI